MSIPVSPDAIDCEEVDYLFSATSTILNSGQGLFTAIDIFKHEIVAIYTGEILSAKEASLRANKKMDAYFMNLPNGKILDCGPTACLAKYANDAEGFFTSNKKNNAMIMLNDQGQVCLVAIRNIKKNEEIFCSYGKRYWIKYVS